MENKEQKQEVVYDAMRWTNDPGNYTAIMDWAGFERVHSASPLLWDNHPKYKDLSLEVKTLIPGS